MEVASITMKTHPPSCSHSVEACPRHYKKNVTSILVYMLRHVQGALRLSRSSTGHTCCCSYSRYVTHFQGEVPMGTNGQHMFSHLCSFLPAHGVWTHPLRDVHCHSIRTICSSRHVLLNHYCSYHNIKR